MLRTLGDLRLEPGTPVLVRADLNVPIRDGVIADDLRIRAVVPTLAALRDRGAAVVVMSHLGRPKGKVVEDLRLAPIAAPLGDLLGSAVEALGETVGPSVEERCGALAAGEVVLLENLRFDPREEADDPGFAAELGRLGDVYVNDAFGCSHRAHASVAAICGVLPHAAGLLVEAEVAAFGRLLTDPPRPFVGILGGAKVSDKLAVIEALLDKVDALCIGGAMCFTFARALGGEVGDSLVEEDRIPDVRRALARADELGKDVLLPVDVVCAARVDATAETVVTPPGAVPAGMMGLDVGPETVEVFAERIAAAGAVLWNGPMGVFETPPFDAGTRGVAEAFAAADAFTVAGGGDSAAALRQMGLAERISHLSTGGGASLEYIELGGRLPGLVALEEPDPS